MTGDALNRTAAGLLIVALAACASQRQPPSAGDAAFATGDWAAAVVAYEAESAADLQTFATARRLRFALALAAAEPPHGDRDRARAMLSDLRSDDVVGDEAAAVLALVDHVTSAEEAGRRVTARVAELRAEVDRCGAAVARLDEARAAERAEAARAAAECEEVRARVAELEGAVARRDAELAELRAMIEELKHVDLEPEP
ncbi:MAG TPA: hypothetical protein VLT32_01765 [Candidatus Sulfomarinibacteraceae bacterium]|nr:hypothetical protein [Candidatus Sulfomarinibacteraceae bacterium]